MICWASLPLKRRCWFGPLVVRNLGLGWEQEVVYLCSVLAVSCVPCVAFVLTVFQIVGELEVVRVSKFDQ